MSQINLATLMLTMLRSGSGLPLPLTSLVSYWKLEEASGSRADSYGTNTLSPTNTPGNAAGISGNAAAFVGASSQQIVVADNASLRSGNIDHTISAWVYPGSVTGLQCIACKADSDTANFDGYEFMLYLNGTNVVFLVSKGTGGTGNNTDTISSDVTVSTNTWYYVEGYFNATGGILGVAVNTTVKTKTSATIPGTTTGSFRIGAIQSNYYLTGRVDEVSFWKRLLTTDERAYLYNSGAGRTLFLA